MDTQNNYTSYGYDKFLQRPIAEAPKQPLQEFDASVDDFSWDKGRGGQVNLGGSNNNNGLLYTTDQQGNKKLSIDNTGIHLADPKEKLYSPVAGSTLTLDVSIVRLHKIQMPSGNISLVIDKSFLGECFIIEITQDSVGSRTVSWFSTIKWSGGGIPPTLTTTANKRDTFGFRVTGNGTYDGGVIFSNL